MTPSLGMTHTGFPFSNQGEFAYMVVVSANGHQLERRVFPPKSCEILLPNVIDMPISMTVYNMTGELQPVWSVTDLFPGTMRCSWCVCAPWCVCAHLSPNLPTTVLCVWRTTGHGMVVRMLLISAMQAKLKPLGAVIAAIEDPLVCSPLVCSPLAFHLYKYHILSCNIVSSI